VSARCVPRPPAHWPRRLRAFRVCLGIALLLGRAPAGRLGRSPGRSTSGLPWLAPPGGIPSPRAL
jgi:hypothetical protein